MTRHKRAGPMLVVEQEPKPVEEVSMRELSRDTSTIVARVREGRAQGRDSSSRKVARPSRRPEVTLDERARLADGP